MPARIKHTLLQEHAITSDEILVLDELPERAVIVGAGYIALEFAGILNGYGVDTHIMFRGNKPLRGCVCRVPIPLHDWTGKLFGWHSSVTHLSPPELMELMCMCDAQVR